MRRGFLLSAPFLFPFVTMTFVRGEVRDPRRAQTHGTVNIFLANKNGLVVVTDSMLTYSGDSTHPPGTHPPDPAQKLFQLDDRTICTIANAYWALGPEPDLQLDVPNSIRQFAQDLRDHPKTNLTQKLGALGFILQIQLSANAIANAISGSTTQPEKLQLTIAGYDDDGSLKIAEEEISPVKVRTHIEFEVFPPSSIASPTTNQPVCEIAGIPDPARKNIRAVGDYFVCKIAGIPDFAEPILSNPESYRGSDPTLKQFAQTSRKDELTLLSTDDLKAIAGSLETETDKGTLRLGHHEVGREKQIAVLANGKVKEFQPLINAPPDTVRPKVGFGLFSIGLEGFGTQALDSSSTQRVIAIDCSLKDFLQVIDGTYFSNSKFVGMQVGFNGTIDPFLGPDNTFIDCTLILGPDVDSKSPEVQKLVETFLWKRVLRSSKTLVTGPLALLPPVPSQP
jgi:hypothetical protein